MNPQLLILNASIQIATTHLIGNWLKYGRRALRTISNIGSELAQSHRARYWSLEVRKTEHHLLHPICLTLSWIRLPRQATCQTRTLSIREPSCAETEKCTLTAMRTKVRTSTPSRVKLGRRKFLSDIISSEIDANLLLVFLWWSYINLKINGKKSKCPIS